MAPLFLRLDRQGGDNPAGKGDGPQRGGGCPLAVIGRGYTPCGYV